MAQVRCADGRLLDVRPVPVLDRTGTPYEVTLELLLDGAPWGAVGERAAGALQAAADRLDGGPVETPADALRRADVPDAVRRAVRPHLPRDVELLALAARDPDDVAGEAELRVLLRCVHAWDGGWTSRTDVVVQAWGSDGTGVRAALDVAELRALLTALLEEVARVTAREAGG